MKSKIVFTNGCFDLLHYGHIVCLREARKLGSKLIVGLNSDKSICNIKGPTRPIIPQYYRKLVLLELKCVDEVITFNDPTPVKLIEFIHPDIIVKGGDWEKEDVTGKDLVESWEGKVVIIPYIPGFSTTNIIEKVRRFYATTGK